MHQYNPGPIRTVLCLDPKSFLKELNYLVVSFTLLKFKSVIFHAVLCLIVDILTCIVFTGIIRKLIIQSSNKKYVLSNERTDFFWAVDSGCPLTCIQIRIPSPSLIRNDSLYARLTSSAVLHTLGSTLEKSSNRNSTLCMVVLNWQIEVEIENHGLYI